MARKNAVKDNLEQIQHQSYSELQELLSEANSMLADSAAFAGDKADSARARIGALLEKANDALGKGGSAVAERSATRWMRRKAISAPIPGRPWPSPPRWACSPASCSGVAPEHAVGAAQRTRYLRLKKELPMLSIKKNLGLLAMTAALAACASNPNDLPDFPEHEYAATQQVGEGVINGDLYLTSASGAIQKGTNTKVTLEPATSYMKAYYAKFGNLDAAKRDPDVQPPVLDPRRATYVREATTDQNGRFDFDHIPNGTYYISSELTWSAQSDGKTITEGGTVTKLVTVSGSQPQKVLLTR